MLKTGFLTLILCSLVSVAHAGFWDELQKAAEVVDAVTQEPAPTGDSELSDYRNPADPAFEEWVRMWENRVLSRVELIRYRDALLERNHSMFEQQLRETAGDFEKRPGWQQGLLIDNKQQRIRQLADCITYEISGDNRVQASSYTALATQPYRRGELAYDKAENCLKAFSQVVAAEQQHFAGRLAELEAAEQAAKAQSSPSSETRVTGFMGIELGMPSTRAREHIEKDICPGIKKQKALFLDRTEYEWYPDCLNLQGMNADLLVNKGKFVNEIRVFYHRYDPAVFHKLQKALAGKYAENVTFSEKQKAVLGHSREMQYEIYDDGQVLLTVDGKGIQSSMSVWYMNRQAESYPEFAEAIARQLRASQGDKKKKSAIGYDVF